MKILSFDLNTRYTGVFGVIEDKDGNITRAISTTIITPNFDVSSLGFKKTKATFKNRKGESYAAYVKPGEANVTMDVKKKRDAIVRHARNEFYLNTMMQKIDAVLKSVVPDKVIIERNEMFNGILTIELLAKLCGMLKGLCVSNNILTQEESVVSVRAHFDIIEMVNTLKAESTPSQMASYKDSTKEAIRHWLSKIYPMADFKTTDESDAALCYHFDRVIRRKL